MPVTNATFDQHMELPERIHSFGCFLRHGPHRGRAMLTWDAKIADAL